MGLGLTVAPKVLTLESATLVDISSFSDAERVPGARGGAVRGRVAASRVD